MSLSAIDTVRYYAREATERGVLAISPRSISKRLSCSDKEAVAMLHALQQEGYGELRGYVQCQSCGETMPLLAVAMMDMVGEVAGLVVAPCRFCGNLVAWDKDDVEVQLSFFLTAVAGQKATAVAASRGGPRASEGSGVSLETLKEAQSVNVQQLILVNNGGQCVVKSSNEYSAKSEAEGSDVVKVAASGQLEVTGEKVSSSQVNLSGRETVRQVKTRSKFMAWCFGEVKEERVREGQYKEASSKRHRLGFRIATIVVVTALAVGAIGLLIKLFH